MIDRFEIINADSARPDAERIIFCDGTGDELFRAETDIELSHWRPNCTPKKYRAGTSTEICFRFLDDPLPGLWTAAVNNHVDVDGILSVYVLVQSKQAREHRQAIIEAADMGDFWGWGEPPAQRLFQGITKMMRKGGDAKSIYAEAFRRIPGLIEGSDPQIPEIDESLAPLREGVKFVEQGQIARALRSERFAQYIVPLAVAGDDDERASYAPGFNEAISNKMVLWPEVRCRWDTERVCLVSTERKAGWFHDLCAPGYLWADTEGKWLFPGLTYHEKMSRYDIDYPSLITAVEDLQRKESAPGRWGLGGTHLPFGETLQDVFPIVGRFLDSKGQPAVSQLSPEEVAEHFNQFFRKR